MREEMSVKSRHIVLIGFMGSGKSTLGIKLSYRLRRVVEDTDKLIEKKTGKKISDIFAEEGEGYFRNLETDVLRSLCETSDNVKYSPKIFSVGGGTPVREENRQLLKQLGTVVYLRIRPETVYKRLKRDTTRPLLQGDNPEEKIRILLEARKEAYESCADLIIDVDDMDMVTILDIIEEYLHKGELEQ